MTEEFTVGEMVYDTEIYDKCNQFVHDIPLYIEIAKQCKGDVLELCCGNGRITIPMAKDGINVTGLDYTSSMIEDARRKAKEQNLAIDFVQGDMRDFAFDKKFSFIFIPFNSLLNTHYFDDYVAIFDNVKKSLNDDGLFMINIFNPNFKYLIRDENLKTDLFEFSLSDGRHVKISETMKYDVVSQVNRVKWHFKIDNQPEKVQRLDMRCFFPQEIDAWLKLSGFEIVKKYGKFDKSDFEASSPNQIILCRKA